MPLERVIEVNGRHKGWGWYCRDCHSCSPTFTTEVEAERDFWIHEDGFCGSDWAAYAAGPTPIHLRQEEA